MPEDCGPKKSPQVLAKVFLTLLRKRHKKPLEQMMREFYADPKNVEAYQKWLANKNTVAE